MKLYLARHGQTNFNELHLCNSDSSVDVHLTQIGIRQATDLAEKLRNADFECIFISELKRTKQTADIINKYHSAPISIDSRLNDNRTGFENKPVAEYYAALDSSSDKWTVRLNDGESLEDVKKRVKAFIDDLKAETYSEVLIVTSMVIVQAFYGIINNLTNQEAWDFAVDKGSCIELAI